MSKCQRIIWIHPPPPAAVTTVWRRWPSISCHLDAELPSIQKSTIHCIQCIFCITLVIKSSSNRMHEFCTTNTLIRL
jgi:hypothetical protein